MTSNDVLREQLAYYNARAQEYDDSIIRSGRFSEFQRSPTEEREWATMMVALRSLKSVDSALELACGTGIWTVELAKLAQRVTAIDGAAAMLETNRMKLSDDPRVTYKQVDLFEWTPDETFDLVFFAFWLSHVPPDKLERFLDAVRAAVKPGGRLMIVDEPAGGRETSGPVEDGQYQTRELSDGRQFRIIKIYYDPAAVQQKLQERGFTSFMRVPGEHFFGLIAS